MQLRSYMNGHSRQGQRKHYRGLSNPLCVHSIELVPLPNLTCLDEEDMDGPYQLHDSHLKLATLVRGETFQAQCYEGESSSEHCLPGEFVRAVPLSTRIPEDTNIEAYYHGPGSLRPLVGIKQERLKCIRSERYVQTLLSIGVRLGLNEFMVFKFREMRVQSHLTAHKGAFNRGCIQIFSVHAMPSSSWLEM
ncbi:hypothetical protein Bca101_017699 [Brassica carinata]